MDTQTITIMFWGMAAIIVFAVGAFTIGSVLRDITTKTLNTGKMKDHMNIFFTPQQGVGWTELVKLSNQQTGEFDYQGRKYCVGQDRFLLAYPPGRSKLAQVPIYHSAVDPESSDTVLTMSGKPSINPVLLYNLVQQKDTTTAMERGAELSGGFGGLGKMSKWLVLGIILVGIIAIVGVIFSIRGTMAVDNLQIGIDKIKSVFPGLQ